MIVDVKEMFSLAFRLLTAFTCIQAPHCFHLHSGSSLHSLAFRLLTAFTCIQAPHCIHLHSGSSLHSLAFRLLTAFTCIQAPHCIHMRNPVRKGAASLVDSMDEDGLIDCIHKCEMGVTAEAVAQKWEVTRDDQVLRQENVCILSLLLHLCDTVCWIRIAT